MKRALAIALLLVVGSGWRTVAQQVYKPAEVGSAGDVYVPYQVVVDGLFVLDVSLDKDGKIQHINAVRDPGSMLGAAKTSVVGWSFKSAFKEGKPNPGRVTVSFVYRPPEQWGRWRGAAKRFRAYRAT